MNKIKIIAITALVTGAIVIGGSTYATIIAAPPAGVPIQKVAPKEVKPTMNIVSSSEKEEQKVNPKVTEVLSVEERLSRIEKRLEALENK